MENMKKYTRTSNRKPNMTTVRLSKRHKDFIKKHKISLTLFVNYHLDKAMEKEK